MPEEAVAKTRAGEEAAAEEEAAVAPSGNTMYRKGKPFGVKPTFKHLFTGEGEILRTGASDAPVPCLFARFGPVAEQTGRVKIAAPPEADESVDNVGGSIAVVQRGKCSFESKMRTCAAGGAVGVVLVNSEDERFLAMPDPPDVAGPQDAPAVPLVVAESARAHSYYFSKQVQKTA